MSNSISNAQVSILLIANAMHEIFPREITDQMQNIQVMQDSETFDTLISIKRKRDGGRAVIRLHPTQIQTWSSSAKIHITEEEKAMIVLFFSE
jgi:hypothetical protein